MTFSDDVYQQQQRTQHIIEECTVLCIVFDTDRSVVAVFVACHTSEKGKEYNKKRHRIKAVETFVKANSSFDDDVVRHFSTTMYNSLQVFVVGILISNLNISISSVYCKSWLLYSICVMGSSPCL